MINWLFWVVLVVLLFYVYFGYKKGIVSIVLSIAVLLGSMLLTSIIAPVVSNFVMDNTKIYESIQKSTYESMKKNNVVRDAINKSGEETGMYELEDSSISELGSEFDTAVKQIVEQISLPETWKTKILDANVGEVTSENVIQMTNSLEDVITSFLAIRIAGIVCTSGCYIISFIIVYFILMVVSKAVSVVSNMPVIRTVNRLLGAVVGLLQGVLVVWVFFVFMTVFYNTEIGISVMACVDSNAFLSALYDNNIIMKILMAFSLK